MACIKHFYPLLVTEHSILNSVQRNFSGLPKNTNYNTGYYSSNNRPAKTTNLLGKVNKQFVKTYMTEEEMDIKEHCKLFWNVSHLLPMTPGGGRGWYFRKFWAGMCHWDPGTLSLYQGKFSWILLPYTRLNSPNTPYRRVAALQKLLRSPAQSSQNKTDMIWKSLFQWSGFNIKDSRKRGYTKQWKLSNSH